MQSLLQSLAKRYAGCPESLRHFKIGLSVGTQWSVLRFGENQIETHLHGETLDEPVHFSIYFADEETAGQCFSDLAYAMHAFQRGELRSSGYIMRTFAVLRAFPAS